MPELGTGWLLPAPMPPLGPCRESCPPQGAPRDTARLELDLYLGHVIPRARCGASEGDSLPTGTWAGNKTRKSQTAGGGEEEIFTVYTPGRKSNPECKKQLQINFCQEPEIFAPLQSWQRASSLLLYWGFFLQAPNHACSAPHTRNKLW